MARTCEISWRPRWALEIPQFELPTPPHASRKVEEIGFDKYGMYVSSGYLALSGFAHLINCIRHVLARSTLSLSQSEVFCTDREPASPSRELIQTSMC